MIPDDLGRAGTAHLRALLARGELSAVELVRATLARIETVDGAINCFAAVHAESALAAARTADAARARGDTLGPLHGVPVAIKDLTPVAGHVTTRGSHVYADSVSPDDAVAVRRLRAAGAVIVGKTTTPELAHAGFTESPLLGVSRNPWDPERTPGGSSGGSAAAVASGCVALAEGSDMGGSIRAPAAFCGVFGLKPSLGRVPLEFLPTTFEPIAHLGPIARSSADLGAFLDACAGPDDADALSLPPDPGGAYARGADVRDLRVAVSPDLGYYAVDADVAANLEHASDALRDAGARVEPVGLEWTSAINDAWYTYWQVYLRTLYGRFLPEHRERMTPALVGMIEAAADISALELKRIDLLRTRQWHELARVLAHHDVLLCPTTARSAPPIGATGTDAGDGRPDGRCHELELTHPFNFVGACPVASVPTGLDSAGLPTAAQVVGRRFDERTVLRVCAALEAADPMHGRTPPDLQPGSRA